jgi:type II secretory ATPase GspE/PulE/Tfp pilus assembly ATPase PilB-like protein
MDIQPYLVASAVAGVVAQRLLKKVCGECKQAFKPTAGLLRDLGLDATSKRRMFRGQGCSACLNTGCSGRTGVFEVFRVNEQMRYLIMEKTSEDRIETEARGHGFRSLRENALEKVYAGIVSPDEVLRTIFLNE